jgi:hypothetical protein
MRQLQPHETARPGDWFYIFGTVTQTGWIRLDAPGMPFYRMTIQEADESNKAPHFPIVIARPNAIERLFGTAPNWKPNQHKIRKQRQTGE